MKRKSKKNEKVVEQIPTQLADEPAPQPTPAPPEPTPEPVPAPIPEPIPEPQPIPEPATPEPIQEATPIALSDEELPPPPPDVVESTKHFPALKTRKPGPVSGLKRAGALFGKDVSTIAKHGLISSVILLVFLMIIYYIASYTMFTLVTTNFGDGSDGGKGDGGPNLGNDGSLIANAGSNRTVNAGSVVTLSSSATVHKTSIVFAQWEIESKGSPDSSQHSLYGPEATYRFDEVGNYTVNLMVVDSLWNADGANFTVKVNPSTSDTTPPTPMVNTTGFDSITYGTPVTFNASDSTDNIGIVNWTWTFHDVIDRTRWGKVVTYTFEGAGNWQVTLDVRDAAGNVGHQGGNINVKPTDMSDMMPNAMIGNLPQSVRIGDTVNLDASQSSDDRGIAEYVWYISLNNTRTRVMGERTSFVASGFGMYDITLVVRDQAGNAATNQMGLLSLSKGMDMPSGVLWTSTPLGQDIPLNVLTFAYGASLLASVIYIGGLFSKGFAHEIIKGTAKTLFFTPLSVTNMVFAKLLYPLIIGPLFIFPLLLISLTPLAQEPFEVLQIGIVSYALTALVMVSAAYGACMIFAATKRMSIKPTALARSFMYLSLVGTLTVFAGLSYLLDKWFNTDAWNATYLNFGPKIAMFSPFHQGGVFLSNLLVGTSQSIDWVVFVIPLLLIVGGILASRKLYGDIFTKE